MADESTNNIVTTIGISAKANTKGAVKNLDDLTQRLKALQDVANAGINEDLTRTLSGIGSVAAALRGMKGTGITKATVANLNAFTDALNNLTTIDTASLAQIASSMRTIGAATVATSQASIAGMEELVESLSNLDEVFDSIVINEHKVADAADKAADELEKEGDEAEEAEEKTEDLAEAVKKTTSRFGAFLASIKRIAMYRMIRSALKAITQGFREGVQNMYQYSLLINGTFKDSMDTLATSALYLKNALGSLVAPIINALAPAIDYIVDRFVDFLNVITRTIALLTGAATWSKALKYPKAYAEALDGANGKAKELRATLLGFDEINRLDDATKGARGAASDLLDYSKMFEEVDTGTWGDFWDDIFGVGESKFGLFAGSLATILSLKLGGAFAGIFGGATATSVLGQFTALLLAAFGGFSLGNWLYNNVPAVHNFADDIMESWMGPLIDDVVGGWELMYDEAIKWGDKIGDWFDNDFVPAAKKAFDTVKKYGSGIWSNVKSGWKIMYDDAVTWGGKINDWVEKHIIEGMPDIKYAAKDAWNGFLEWVGLNNKIDIDVEVTKESWTRITNDITNMIDGVLDEVAKEQGQIDKQAYKAYLESQGGGGNTSPAPVKSNTTTKKSTTTSVFSNIASTLNNLASQIGGTNIKPYAGGGTPETGSLFLAREGGEPELVAQVGHQTQVANNDQIVQSIQAATENANAEGNMYLREAVSVLQKILAKETTVVASVSTDSIVSGLDRQNRRNGRTTVPIGG